MTLGVIISTYNHPTWLEKTLWGYLCQTRPADEIIIADDGSTPDTRQLVMQFAAWLPIKHVWHDDQGFRKTRILNQALRAAQSDYLVFTDQDCVPRQDFLAVHAGQARRGRFLSGGLVRLPLAVSQLITQGDISSQRAFDLRWLRSRGLKCNFKCSKLAPWPWFSRAMNAITPAKATWNGCNASGWRHDLLAARGFDERMKYGGEDREMGERLVNAGIKGKQVRYTAIAIHLDHDRPYVDPQAIEQNNQIRQQTHDTHAVATRYGL